MEERRHLLRRRGNLAGFRRRRDRRPRGLTRRLDYLWGLGINTLWMMPFHPSPLGDDGYDVTDHYAVDSRFGTLGDFVEMIRTADNLGIRVLVDLVMSHTSDQHPWFQRSRHDRDSRYRDYYR